MVFSHVSVMYFTYVLSITLSLSLQAPPGALFLSLFQKFPLLVS